MSPKTRTRTGAHTSHRRRRGAADNTGLIPQLAKAAREIEAAGVRGRVSPANRTKFQVVALLMREERTRLKGDDSLSDSERTEALRRLDGLASIIAKIAARDTSLLGLLDSGAPLTTQARALRKQMLFAGGVDIVVDEPEARRDHERPLVPPEIADRQVLPKSVKARVRSTPFLTPRLDRIAPPAPHYSPLSNWDVVGPILKAFETGAGGGAASMELPAVPRRDRLSPPGLTLMPHQIRFLEEVRAGHRTFLLADEPGLGKTAQSVIAASVAQAYPLLCVVPNVVKTNWAREVERWTPHRRATLVTGDGGDVDAFADVFIVNYEILDRHIGWMQKLGFAGMVLDEAHFIKNRHSQRSRLVMQLAEGIRDRVPGADPLFMALTGTPLINHVEDFMAIWEYLGWFKGDRPSQALMDRLDATGLVPSDPGFMAAARRAVIDMGIVRRRKVDVAKDLPAKRIIDMPVELDSEEGRSIRQAEEALRRRLIERYDRMLAAVGLPAEMIDENRVRLVARQEVDESKARAKGESIFSVVRRLGVAKAELAAEYAAQLAHSVGKVVFFAKHIEAMDTAMAALRERGVRAVAIRGDQSAIAREAALKAFQSDPGVEVIVCSLLAAGVGLNLQVASDVVLAELSWTAAEQTQAIDRVHRIGQDESVTAWRIVAAQTIDARIASLIGSKQGLAERALEGVSGDAGEEDVQVEALVQLLEDTLRSRPRSTRAAERTPALVG